jgi:DNA-binding transcriptional regulator YbjK
MRNKKAVDPDIRRSNILRAALELARRDGYMTMTRDKVAAHAGVATGSVNLAYKTMDALRVAVMAEAIKQEIIEIMADGFGRGDPQMKLVSKDLRQKCVDYLM